MSTKKSQFEYFIKGIVQWYCDLYGIEEKDFNAHPNNDLSKLKLIKLHFFACSTDDEALNIFNNFHAMPYGHVESDVYNDLSDLEYFSIVRNKVQIRDVFTFSLITCSNPTLIDNIISKLKSKNPRIIKMAAFDLVELSHRWFSWKYTFEQAKKSKVFSKPINSELIKHERKIYSLS